MGLFDKDKFYSLERIKKEDATYNMIIGERSNGKTFAVLNEILINYIQSKGKRKGAIIRRWDLDFKRGRGQAMFTALIDAGKLNLTSYHGIDYKNGSWWLYRYDEDLDKKVYDEEPFCFSFSLSQMEHDKSTSYPDIDTIVFDEFLTRSTPLPDEFVLFMNTLSTIIRHRDNVKIYMLGNTVNKESEYFKEMGITNIATMEQGDIDVYTYGESDLKVAVEYCNTNQKAKKKSDKYFAFNNSKLKMITGGAWEINLYPHLPVKYKHKEVKKEFFILYNDYILHCDVVRTDNKEYFIYIHKKTTPIKDEDHDLIYSNKEDARRNWRRRIDGNSDDVDRKIWQFFKQDKVYYQSNEIGEIVRNYLIYCQQYAIIKT